MEYRRFGRTEHQTSVLVFGAAALASSSPQETRRVLEVIRAAGINHIDTAASYGDAEVLMGPHMADLRKDVFLATKTTERTAQAAWTELQRSMERMQVDHIDLWQVHAVGDDAALDDVFAPRGPLPAFERARDEGLVTFLGITGHTEQAPRVHLEALRRFDFDSVLCPMNHQMYRDPQFAEDFTALSEEVARRDVGLRTIKTVARRPWAEGEQHLKTWYHPLTDPEHVRAAVSWVLGTFPQIAGIATASDPTLQEQLIDAEAHRMDVSAADEILAGIDHYTSIFV